MLALEGGKPAVTSPLKPYNSIGPSEVAAAVAAIKHGPLSGFKGGERQGGLMVQTLEQEVCQLFGVKHAISVNSATSGLLIACMACDASSKRCAMVPAVTMSATGAAPRFLGAKLLIVDVEDRTYSGLIEPRIMDRGDIVIPVNLFGHPAHLHDIRRMCDGRGVFMIEDNAQAPFAIERGKYAGTIGHIGVLSGNIHKMLQCGEGGICLTDDDYLADRMRLYRNHAELAGSAQVGLNLRLGEIESAIWLSQLQRYRQIIDGRIEQAESFTHMVKNIPGVYPPTIREGCTHVYYGWPIQISEDELGMSRDEFVDALCAEGLPFSKQYAIPLGRLRAFQYESRPSTPTADRLYDSDLAFFENCMYDPSGAQMKQIEDAFHKVGEYAQKNKQRVAAGREDR